MIFDSPLSYVGPGPGLTMFWAFLALLGTIALAVLSLLIWPIRVLIKRLRGEAPPAADAASPKSAPEATPSAPKSE